MTTDADLVDLSWLDLIPEELLLEGYREALEVEARESQRAARLSAKIAAAEGMLRRELAGTDDPFSMASVAAELASFRVLAEHMPATGVVSDVVHQDLAFRLYQSLPMAGLSLGRPPAPFAERQHFAQYHQGEHLPPINDAELEIMATFVDVSKRAVPYFNRIVALREPLGEGQSIANRVRAVTEIRDQVIPEVAQTFAVLERAVAESNDARWRSKRVHRCPVQSGNFVFQLPEVPFSAHPFDPDARNYGFIDAVAYQAIAS